MLVSRSTSARIHRAISSSLRAGSSWPRSFQAFTASPMKPEPLAGTPPPMATRSFISVVSTTRQPSPGSLRRSESGMRASVKYTSLNSASPVIWYSGRTSTPGPCMSTTK